jgi:hypothetical protein
VSSQMGNAGSGRVERRARDACELIPFWNGYHFMVEPEKNARSYSGGFALNPLQPFPKVLATDDCMEDTPCVPAQHLCVVVFSRHSAVGDTLRKDRVAPSTLHAMAGRTRSRW